MLTIERFIHPSHGTTLNIFVPFSALMEVASGKGVKKTSLAIDMFNDKTALQKGPKGCVTKQLVVFTGLYVQHLKISHLCENPNNALMVLFIYLFQESGFPI